MRVDAATTMPKANATLACVLGKPAELEWPSQAVPKPTEKGRGIGRKCCPSRASSQAVSMAINNQSTRRRTCASPTKKAPTVPATSNWGNSSDAKRAIGTSQTGDDAVALSQKNSVISSANMT